MVAVDLHGGEEDAEQGQDVAEVPTLPAAFANAEWTPRSMTSSEESEIRPSDATPMTYNSHTDFSEALLHLEPEDMSVLTFREGGGGPRATTRQSGGPRSHRRDQT